MILRALTAWLLVAGLAFAQVRVGGIIYDVDLQGIPDVKVALPEYQLEAYSDSLGVFTIYSTASTQIQKNAAVTETPIDYSAYRIYVPNGARRLLPIKEIANLPDGIYYLVPGRFYAAKQRIVVLDGRIAPNGAQLPIGNKSVQQLQKVLEATPLTVTKPGVVDTSILISDINSTSSLQINTTVPSNTSNTEVFATPIVGRTSQTSSFTDSRDGNVYRTVEVGGLTWMAENLRFDTLNNLGSRCPGNLTANCAKYGRLYDWSTVMSLPRTFLKQKWDGEANGHRGLCPEGWRVPSNADWEKLEAAMGMNAAQIDSINWRGAGFGAQLKAKDASWLGGSNLDTYEWAAKPAGYYNGSRGGTPGSVTYFWSGSEQDSVAIRVRGLLLSKTGINNMSFRKDWMFSLRCVTQGSGVWVEPSSSSQGVSSSSGSDDSDSIDANTFVDPRDNHRYPFAIIGNQTWMTSNLHYAPASITGHWCVVGGESKCEEYGRYYTQPTAMTVCPTGWRLPSEQDFLNLESTLGFTQAQLDSSYWRGSPHAGKLKADTSTWQSGLHANESRFSAMPNGFWNTPENRFKNLGTGAFYWSATTPDTQSARARVILTGNNAIFAFAYPQTLGFSVRCIRNDSLDGDGNLILPITPGAGYVIWEKWMHFRGNGLDKVPWNSLPNDTGRLTSLETPDSFDDRFGLRIRGYITAPENGPYTFRIETDGVADLWISTSTNPAAKQLLLDSEGKTSLPVTLERGKRYYFETRYKEAWTNDHFSIDWTTPKDPTPTPVPGEWLSPYTPLAISASVCASITPTAHDTAWPAYCSENTGNCGTFIDERNCQEYRWTQIGTQKWMAENLNIGTKVDGSLDQIDNTAIEKYCYNNLDSMCTVYGGLYQWHEAMGLDDSCTIPNCKEQTIDYHVGICPTNWRIPNYDNWNNLIDVISSEVAGLNVKKLDIWNSVENFNDSHGFSAVPSGERNLTIPFSFINNRAFYWGLHSQTSENNNWLLQRLVNTISSRKSTDGKYAFSLRCIQ